MSRRFVTLYLGTREQEALSRRPQGMKRGKWLNLIAATIARWSAARWEPFLQRLAPPPNPRKGKLTLSLPTGLADELDAKRGQVPLADILRTALLLAAKTPYRHVPAPAPFDPPSGDHGPHREGSIPPRDRLSMRRLQSEWFEVALHLDERLSNLEHRMVEIQGTLNDGRDSWRSRQTRFEHELSEIRSSHQELRAEIDELNDRFVDWISFRTGIDPEEDSQDEE